MTANISAPKLVAAFFWVQDSTSLGLVRLQVEVDLAHCFGPLFQAD